VKTHSKILPFSYLDDYSHDSVSKQLYIVFDCNW